MEEKLLKLLGRKSYTPGNVPELLRKLGLPSSQHQKLKRLLRRLEQDGDVARIKGNRYVKPREADLIPGRIRMNRSGKGFLQPDDPALKEIMIPANATGTALHEDRVLVRRDLKVPGLDQNTGTVIRVLERCRSRLVGTLKRGRRFLVVIPDDPRFSHDIYVPEPRDVGRPARNGDKVVVELGDWAHREANPEGEIVEVLGSPDKEGVDMLCILRQYALPLRFPRAVLKEARAIGKTVSRKDLAGRTDCRDHLVVTIDPVDAKDFDDAFYLKREGRDQWRLWVHIADVSHYVKPDTALDEEARKRGNSTYLVDRVIPMLPEALSNELCSLKPGVDRLSKCVEFLLSNQGEVLKARFYPAIIHSRRRYAYEEALKVLEGKPGDAIDRMVHQAHTLAQKIRRRRFQAGALELDFPETKIHLDDRGAVARIETVENDISHQLIEEFMLLANEAVARRLNNKKIKAIHRVHEEPDERRLREYREEVLAHRIPCGNLTKRTEVQRLMRRLHTLAKGPALKIGFLKSLMRARYAVDSLGHYGLAKDNYAHFTSPIRRYADLVVHRALFEKNHSPSRSLKKTADHISDTERLSADAERDSRDVKLYAYLNHLSRRPKAPQYQALVTDIRNFGFFVDVQALGLSGLVPFSGMDDDFYAFDPKRRHIVGQHQRRIIRLGDTVTVTVAKVDAYKKQVDFKLVTPGKSKKQTKAHTKAKGKRKSSNNNRTKTKPKRQPGRRRKRR